MKPIIARSLAGSDKYYVVALIRPREGMLHIQIPGPSENRPYGMAWDLELPAEVRIYLESLLADSDADDGT